MSVSRVKSYLEQWNLQDRIKEFHASSATVELAAEAVGCEPARIAKTMSFLINGEAVLVVLAGDVKIDNRKFKDRFQTKACMIRAEDVKDKTGHPVGGVCPFDVKDGVYVYLDESLRRFDTVYPAGGSGNSAVRLTLPELELASHCKAWVDVSKMAE